MATAEVAVLVVPENLTLETPHPVIRVADARLALAQLTQLFDTRAPVAEGRHRGVTVHPKAVLVEGVHLAANVTIAAGAQVGARYAGRGGGASSVRTSWWVRTVFSTPTSRSMREHAWATGFSCTAARSSVRTGLATLPGRVARSNFIT